MPVAAAARVLACASDPPARVPPGNRYSLGKTIAVAAATPALGGHEQGEAKALLDASRSRARVAVTAEDRNPQGRGFTCSAQGVVPAPGRRARKAALRLRG